MRTNKYKFDKNYYISNLSQNINHPNKAITGTYINIKPNSYKYIENPSYRKYGFINYASLNNIFSSPEKIINQSPNPAM